MKRFLLSFLFCSILYPSVYAQEGGLEKDSLPVFVIQDRKLSSIVDEFIAQSQKFDDKSLITFYIHINLGDKVVSVNLDIKEQSVNSDSLILYKNPHYHQAFIRHQNILFFANITSSAYAYKYDVLAEWIKRLPTRQNVYFKDSPVDFYEISEWGGNPLEGLIFSSFHEFDGTKWCHGILEDGPENEWIIEEPDSTPINER
ncbi:MAG: hypothetical protein LBR65_03515 [Culturomica sp.]|jgi:hypothetical protein|nr:hypothetical protein [Culturomica sp.]